MEPIKAATLDGAESRVLQDALSYQVAQIQKALEGKGIHLSLKDIANRLALAVASGSLTQKIVSQVELCPKEMSKMSVHEKVLAAGWAKSPSAGTKETSRAVLKEILGDGYER